ncbi:MAG: cyclic nucleotide-binding domain-containing protein [Acidimicrobiales bacterium]
MAKPASVQEFVRAVPLFSNLLPSELDRVAYVMHPQDVGAGHVLCAEGDEGHEFYVIADGEAVVERGGHAVAKLSRGDYFGELALLDQGPRSATVKAMTDMRLYVLNEQSFTAVLAEVPALAQKLLAALATRLREAEAHADLQ